MSSTYRQIARRVWLISLFCNAEKRAAASGDSEMAAAWSRAMAKQGRLPERLVPAAAAPKGGS